MKNNNISIKNLAIQLGMPFSTLQNKFAKKIDFTIEDLENIKVIFINKGLIDINFDIGEFLKIVL